MKKFLHFPIRTKLFISFGIMIFLIMIIGITAFVNVSTIQEKNQDIYQINTANIQDALALRGALSDARLITFMLIVEPDNSTTQQLLQNLESEKKKIFTLTAGMITRNSDNENILQNLNNFKGEQEKYASIRDNEIIPLVISGNHNKAKEIALDIQNDRYNEIKNTLNTIIADADSHALDSTEQAKNLATIMNMVIITIFVFSLIVGIGLAIIITKSILDPLLLLAQKANQIAAGDLTIDIPQDLREDEIGMLNDSFRRMLAGLREAYNELSEGINVLAKSSNSILTTTTHIAASVNETATSVNETATSIEEVKQTSDLSSETARLVAEKAQLASNVSQTGQKAVEEMVSSFQRVQEKMESIAENVVQLAEKSQEIGEIIVTVNDIAEQSNILAINASIEAALAGEEGRRFDVVAQEIRNLADQSKQATAQVRTILTDIQRGVSMAVMAAEQGNRTVGESVKQSNEAGESIRTLTTTISESATAAIQSAISSQQQNVGIGQIIQAMVNIKQASMQNLTSSKQAEEISQNLNDLGKKLQKSVNRYRT